MEVITDYLGISDHEIFEKLRKNLPKSKIRTHNIIDCHNDILFVWNNADQNILTLNLKRLQDDTTFPTKHQTLLPTDPPTFPVEWLVLNTTCTQVAVAGPRGVAVLDIQRSWGHGSKESVLCRCRPLDQRYFLCHPHIEVRRIRWHPGSLEDCHLFVLTSENCLRLYYTQAERPTPIQVWQLGPWSESRLRTLQGLADTAVDFDFTVPTLWQLQDPETDGSGIWANTRDIEWPILVLLGNGDILTLSSSLDDDTSSSRPSTCIQGPLSMFPPAEDNYGTDMCALLCLRTLPPIVVVASTAGTIFHCVLLPDTPESSWSECGSMYSLHTPDMALFVLESIELELGLSLDDDSDSVTCPIHLHHHTASNNRYLCSHDAGVHSIALPIVSQLKTFMSTTDNNMHLQLPNLSLASEVEYIVCTKTSASTNTSAIMGLSLTQLPTVLVLLLGSGEVVSLLLSSILIENTINFEMDTAADLNATSPLKMLLKEPFDIRIKNMLKHDLSQPILKISNGNKPSARECMEVVTSTTQLFREDYFLRHERVREEIERRVRTLQSLKQHQLRDLSVLEAEKVSLQQAAERLAEKYEDAKDKQEELTKRAEQVLRLTVQKQPVMSTAEKKLSKDLTSIKDRMEEFHKGLEQVRAKQKYHKEQIHQWNTQVHKRDIYLNQSRAGTLRSTMQNVMVEITDMMNTVRNLKKDLGI